MSKPVQGVIAGVAFGLLMTGLFWPTEMRMHFGEWPSARAVTGVAIGVVIGCVRLPWPGWLIGLAFGLLISLPNAVQTRTYGLNIFIGGVAGLMIGGLIHGWKSSSPFR